MKISMSFIIKANKIFFTFYPPPFLLNSQRLIMIWPTYFNSVFLEDFLRSDSKESVEYAQVAFHQPQFIMFSSGTTGVPKCIVHSVGVSELLRDTVVLKLYCTEFLWSYKHRNWVEKFWHSNNPSWFVVYIQSTVEQLILYKIWWEP